MGDGKFRKPCGRKSCGVSTMVDDETLTFGHGKLDEQGFWEHPCLACAEAWKKEFPDSRVWPGQQPKEKP